MFKAIDGIQNFIAERVKMHKETLDPGSPRDFIDCFLLKMEQVRQFILLGFTEEFIFCYHKDGRLESPKNDNLIPRT